MSRRHPPLAERRPATPASTDLPGPISSHLVPDARTLSLRIGGEGTVLGVDPHGRPLTVRLFRPTQTRIVLVGSPRCAQLVVYRALACGARAVIDTARPQVWSAITAAAPPGTVTVRPLDAGPAPTGGRTHPVLHVDDSPPGDRWNEPPGGRWNESPDGRWNGSPDGTHPPELPDGRWTTLLTLREALTPREVALLDRADLLLLQPLASSEVAVLTTVLRVPGVDDRLARLPADVLTVAHRRGVRWGRLSVTGIEHHHFGRALRR